MEQQGNEKNLSTVKNTKIIVLGIFFIGLVSYALINK
jgi:hypothetical protein